VDRKNRNSPEGEAPVLLRDAVSPAEIESLSFAIIDAEAGDPKPFAGHAWQIARRLAHTSGDLSLLSSLHLPDAAIDAGLGALAAGKTVFTDTQMARHGIPLRRMRPLGVAVECFLAEGSLAEEAKKRGITRARAGMEALGKRLEGAIVAVGNAPTALLALLDMLDGSKREAPRPALVIGMPVGFVNAAEAKELLVRRGDVPCLAVLGRRGGSPLAAATVNALAEIVLQERAGR
jgi:precorrin-8X/cobalt-precorrin-8 methylmutase